jgi:hypothetical protein
VIAAAQSRARDGALWLLFRHRSLRVPGSAAAACVSWSPDGRLLSYLTGKAFVYKQLPGGAGAWGRIGALWKVRASSPRRPLRIASGLFAEGECPAWSASGGMLAYQLRHDPQSGPWTLGVYEGGSSRSVATLGIDLPSIDHQTFAWAPNRAQLVYVDGSSLYSYDGTETGVLGSPGSLEPVETLARSRGFQLSNPQLRFSPDGRHIAAGTSGATGAFARDGTLLQVFAGGFDGWAGNSGILTLAAEPTTLTLRLHPLDGAASRAVVKFFKGQVATDPAGRWFAYFHYLATGYSIFTFRRAEGALMHARPFQRVAPFPIAAVSADGRTAPPAGDYPSDWSR